MKNLLLLFVLGFALFWVGCEKEEFILDQPQLQYSISSKGSDATSRERDEECTCTAVSPVEITEGAFDVWPYTNTFEEGLRGTFEINHAIVIDENSYIEIRHFLGPKSPSNLIPESFQLAITDDCAGLDGEISLGFFVPYSHLEDNCLVRIDTEILWFQNGDGGMNGTRCRSNTISSYFVQGEYAGDTMEQYPRVCARTIGF